MMETNVPALVWVAHRARSPWMRAVLGGLLLLAALWAVPPMLDWGRYRTAIAAIAAGQLGRPVAIGGDVTLRLLPEAVLTAADVTFPAQQGTPQISAKVGALRLQVAFWPLLAGRIVLRDLVLSAPLLTLPWPLPDSFIHPQRPHLPQAFAAHVEGGTLRIGAELLSGITAAIHGGPVAGSLAGPAMDAASFGAEGFASFGSRRWRFTSALGPPDADGVSAIDLSVLMSGGQAAPGHDTGATVQATLADGVVQGRVKAGGPDLSLLMPAARVAWQAEAPFVASSARVETRSVILSLGGVDAQGSATLTLTEPARLDGRIDTDSADLDSWLAQAPAGMAASALRWVQAAGLPMRVALHADQLTLGSGRIQGFSTIAAFDGKEASLESLAAAGPGGLSLSLGRTVLGLAPNGITLRGPVEITAMDLQAASPWLTSIAPGLMGLIPPGSLGSAKLSGALIWSPNWLALLDLRGIAGQTALTGGLGIGLGAKRPRIAADLTLPALDLTPWLAAGPGSLAALGGRASLLPATLALQAGTATWQGRSLKNLSLAAQSGPDGLVVRHLSGSFDGADFTASGTVAADGAVPAAHLRVQTKDVAHVFADLPPAWRWAPGLFHGPATFAAAASFTQPSLSLQLRAEGGDALLEAEVARDMLAGSQSTTLTLRHPGAPRLLASLGLPGAESWLDTGSLTLLAHLQTTPGHLIVQDAALNAAALRLTGSGSLDMTGAVPVIDARVAGDMLALPAAAAAPSVRQSLAVLNAAAAHITLAVQAVDIGLRPQAVNVSSDITAGAGDLLADQISATVAGGKLQGQVAMDSARPHPIIAAHLALLGASAALPPLPVSLDAGAMDLDADITAQGASVADWRSSLAGQAHAALRDASVTGFDLAALSQAATAGAARRKLVQAALSQGTTPGVAGNASALISNGVLSIAPALFTSPAGQLSLSGSIDSASGATSLALGLTPNLPARPIYTLKLTGTWPAIQAAAGLKPALPPTKRALVSHHTPHTPIAADAAPAGASRPAPHRPPN